MTLEHCDRFAAVFDENGDGIITQDEFASFCRFLTLVSFFKTMGTGGGQGGGGEGSPGSMSRGKSKGEGTNIDDMLSDIARDRTWVESKLKELPAETRNFLESPHFLSLCNAVG